MAVRDGGLTSGRAELRVAAERPANIDEARMSVTLLTPIMTVLATLPVGAFWMFVWLVGTNGYSERKGFAILASILSLVVVSIVVATATSGLLAARIQAATQWPGWVVVLGSVAGVLVAWLVVLCVGSFAIVLVVGSTR